jgi:hypothetical protein
MHAYKNDYMNDNNLSISKLIPNLNKNIHLFVRKLDNITSNADIEMQSLIKMRDSLLSTIEVINNKIELVKKYKNNFLETERKLQGKHEQLMIDDIVSTLEERMENE